MATKIIKTFICPSRTDITGINGYYNNSSVSGIELVCSDGTKSGLFGTARDKSVSLTSPKGFNSLGVYEMSSNANGLQRISTPSSGTLGYTSTNPKLQPTSKYKVLTSPQCPSGATLAGLNITYPTIATQPLIDVTNALCVDANKMPVNSRTVGNYRLVCPDNKPISQVGIYKNKSTGAVTAVKVRCDANRNVLSPIGSATNAEYIYTDAANLASGFNSLSNTELKSILAPNASGCPTGLSFNTLNFGVGTTVSNAYGSNCVDPNPQPLIVPPQVIVPPPLVSIPIDNIPVSEVASASSQWMLIMFLFIILIAIVGMIWYIRNRSSNVIDEKQ